jgi:hypothetical protein
MESREELQLLEGLQHCGFGNWLDIAQKVVSKNKEQCEQHYLKFWWANRDRLDAIKEAFEKAETEKLKDLEVKTLRENLMTTAALSDSKSEMDLIKIGLTKSKIDKFQSKLFVCPSKPGRKP